MFTLRRLAIVVPLIAIPLLGSCRRYSTSDGATWVESGSYSSSTSDNSGYSLTLFEDGVKSIYRVEGELRPTLDMRGIQWLEAGGRISIQQDAHGIDRSALLQPDETGAPLLVYRESGQIATFEMDDQDWYASRLAELFGHSDIGAEGYAAAVLEAEGVDGLITRSATMESTGLIEACLKAALNAPDVSKQQCVSLADAIMDVDHESSRVELIGGLSKRFVDSGELTTALITGLNDFSTSDNQQETILAVSRRDLSKAHAMALVDATRNVSYDSTRKDLLIELANLRTLEGEWTRKLLSAADELSYSSSYQEVLEAYSDATVATANDWALLVRATENIDYDSHRAEALQVLIKRMPNDDASLLVAIDSMDSIDTSSYQEDVIDTFAERDQLSAKVWIAMADACSSISTSSTHSDSLLQVIDNAPESLAIHMAVLKSSLELDTSAYMADVLEALAPFAKTEPGLGQAIAKGVMHISYDRHKADVLDILAANAPQAPKAREAHLIACANTVQSVDTSSYQADVLNTILDNTHLSVNVLKAIAKALPHIDYESSRSDIQSRLIDLLVE